MMMGLIEKQLTPMRGSMWPASENIKPFEDHRRALMLEHEEKKGSQLNFEEMLEIVTLKQLDMLSKPIVFLNINGFFDGLLAQFETGYRENFIDTTCRTLYCVTESVNEALDEVLVVLAEYREGRLPQFHADRIRSHVRALRACITGMER